MGWLTWRPADGDRTLPWWVRILLVGTGALRLVFGLTLLASPEVIATVWPWSMTPLATRLLGASTLVSAPLAILSGAYNRYSVARIPIVMMLAYRLLQLVAGVRHIEGFDFSAPPAWNYFLGGGFMLAVLAFVLVRGPRMGRAVDSPPGGLPADGPLRLGAAGRGGMDAIGVVFMSLAVIFMTLASAADPVWIETAGRLTPLTARLFSSPMAGLALGMWLIVRAEGWREVFAPAVGMLVFGVGGTLTLLLQRQDVQPDGVAAWVVVLAPGILFLVGAYLLVPARRGRLADTAPDSRSLAAADDAA